MPRPPDTSTDIVFYRYLDSIVPFFCKNHIHPNVITLVAYPLLFCLYITITKKRVLASLFLLISIRIIDCLDGEVARQCDKKTTFGGYLDIITDWFGLNVVIVAIISSAYPNFLSLKNVLLVVYIVIFIMLMVTTDMENHKFDNSIADWIEQNSVLNIIILWLFWIILIQYSTQRCFYWCVTA